MLKISRIAGLASLFLSAQAFSSSSVQLLSSPARHLAFSATKRLRGGLQMSSSGPLGNSVLYAKQGPKEGVLGDCPFTHKANLALNSKGIEFKVGYIDLANKPDWFLEINEKGSAPTFVKEDGGAVTESEDILTLADALKPDSPPLCGRPGSEEVQALIAPLFGSFAGCMKNKEEAEEPEKREKLMSTLSALNAYLEKAEGPFLLGKDFAAEDCRLAPPLYHISVALPHWKKFDPLAEFPKLQAYLETIKGTEAWKKSVYAPETVVWGWSKFF